MPQALCKGTLCLYIRPNEEGVSYYRDTWGYGQLVYQKHAIEEMAAFRALIKGWMVRGRSRRPAEAERRARPIGFVYERLDQCHVTRSPMWMPGVILCMVGWTHARELKARMTIGLPGARFGGMLVYPRYLTLEFRFMRFLRAVVLEACKEIQARAKAAPRARCSSSCRTSRRNAQSIERFYVTFSHLLRSVYSIEPGEGGAELASRQPSID